MCWKTPSPMLPNASTALLRTAGCWFRSIFTTAWIVDGLEVPCALPMRPTAHTAADVTRTSTSWKSAMTSASCRAPSAPISPKASAATRRTSGLVSVSSTATLSAYAWAPILVKASTAAYLGMDTAVKDKLSTQVLAKTAARLSSKPSFRREATSAAKFAALSPMAPSTAAAAAFSPPFFDARHLATSVARLVTCSPSATTAATAAARTPASSSPRHLQSSCAWPTPSVPILEK
mmetsp:Transcript_82364/g.191268  ORF Transcript_82364/g.191268 Transcript_82364/m.191268 type:complete len:234 (+) Transcript_82364:474-1175(+)